MISTITMVGAGKVYDNLMVDVKATNQKLIDRSIRIVQDICDTSYQQSEKLYNAADHNLKVAIVMHMCETSKEDAKQRLDNNNHIVKQAIRD